MVKCIATQNGKFALNCRENIAFIKGDEIDNLTEDQASRLETLGLAEKVKAKTPKKETKVVSEKETKIVTKKKEKKIVE